MRGGGRNRECSKETRRGREQEDINQVKDELGGREDGLPGEKEHLEVEEVMDKRERGERKKRERREREKREREEREKREREEREREERERREREERERKEQWVVTSLAKKQERKNIYILAY